MSFVLRVSIRIKPENVDRFMKALGENARAARKEPGCRRSISPRRCPSSLPVNGRSLPR